MKPTLILCASAAVILLVLDLIWLGVVAKPIYQAEIGPLLKKDFHVGAAAAFYLLYVVGLTVFVLLPAQQHGDLVRTALMPAFFGLVAYGTYDLTNLATLQGFTVRIAIIDMAWGAFVSAVTATAALFVSQRLS